MNWKTILAAGAILFSGTLFAQTINITCLTPNGGFTIDGENYTILNQGESADFSANPQGSTVELWSCGDPCRWRSYDVLPGSVWNIFEEEPDGFGIGLQEVLGPDVAIAIDIKFCKDPNKYKCTTMKTLPVTIFGTDSFDVADIDPSTLQLCQEDFSACTNGPSGLSIADRGDPRSDLGAAMCAVDLNTGEELDFLNPDGFLDLDAAFEASEVQAMLGYFCDQPKNTVSKALIVIGSTFDGIPIYSNPFPNTGIDQLVKKKSK